MKVDIVSIEAKTRSTAVAHLGKKVKYINPSCIEMLLDLQCN